MLQILPSTVSLSFAALVTGIQHKILWVQEVSLWSTSKWQIKYIKQFVLYLLSFLLFLLLIHGGVFSCFPVSVLARLPGSRRTQGKHISRAKPFINMYNPNAQSNLIFLQIKRKSSVNTYSLFFLHIFLSSGVLWQHLHFFLCFYCRQ